MAQYTINHSCGHTSVVKLYGPSKERISKINWYESQVCLECKKAQDLAESAANANALNLPALVGSEKQIAWASAIRNTMLKETVLEMGLTVAQAVEKYNAADEEQKAKIAIAIAQYPFSSLARVVNVATQSSASWFIENR